MFREHGAQALTCFADPLDEDHVPRGNAHAAFDERFVGTGELSLVWHVRPSPHDTPKTHGQWKIAAQGCVDVARGET